jgi:hypothetical protein
MSSESADNAIPLEGRTLFQVMDPWEVETEVERAEGEILGELRADAPFIRTTIKVLDYLVDQVRFLHAGLRHAAQRGLRGLPALQWAAYLSWPQTQRLAETQWRRDLVRRHAFATPAWLWQCALDARWPDDPVNVGPPPEAIWYPPTLQLGPYPSAWRPTNLTSASLEAHIQFDPWSTPGPLAPVRRLNRAMTWTLQLPSARLYDGRFSPLDIIIDEPRAYSAAEAQTVLRARAAQLESGLGAAAGAASPVPAPVLAQWRQDIERLRAAADQLGRGSTRDRATLLERCFALPGTWWFGPVEILTEDLPPAWLGVMLGFAFDRRGLLSVRDGKLLRQVAAAVFDHWQGTRYPHGEHAPDLTRRVVSRLGGVRRLLQPASLFAYLARLARRRPG